MRSLHQPLFEEQCLSRQSQPQPAKTKTFTGTIPYVLSNIIKMCFQQLIGPIPFSKSALTIIICYLNIMNILCDNLSGAKYDLYIFDRVVISLVLK